MASHSQIKAVIDVGTNSVKLLVAKVAGRMVEPLMETSSQTRLGRGFYQTRRLQPEAIDRTAQVVSDYVGIARQHEAKSVAVIATSAAREAQNTDELLGVVKRTAGVPIRVLSGEAEADYVFRGVISGVSTHHHEMLIIDVGGGSTELILGRGSHAVFHQSVQLGTVRMMEHFPVSDPPAKREWDACVKHVTAIVSGQVVSVVRKHRSGTGPLNIIGTGGTTTLLARIHHQLEEYDRDVIERTVLHREALSEMASRLWSSCESDRKMIPGLPAEKADVLLMGSLIYEGILTGLCSDKLRISMRGLRYGVLIDD